MKSRFLIPLFFLVEIALVVGLFLAFVPPERRTDIVWLNLVIVLLIIFVLSGRYGSIFRSLGDFADNVPFMVVYGVVWKWYCFLAIGGMVLFHCLDLSFGRQALLQGVLLFLFLGSLLVGSWASDKMRSETAMDKAVMGGVRQLQQRFAMVSAIVLALPPQYGTAKQLLRQVGDEINCMVGTGSSQSPQDDSALLALMGEVSRDATAMCSPEQLERTIRALQGAVALRKASLV